MALRWYASLLLLSAGCSGDGRGGGGTNELDVAVAIHGGEQHLAGDYVTLIAYLPGEGYRDTAGISWSWDIEYAPPGSAIAIESPQSEGIEVSPDLPGTYLFRVEARRDGAYGEATALIEAFAYGLGLQVSLTWDIDKSDVDLHLVNLTEGGAFRVEPFDCYFANMNPDWPPQGPAGDPTMDIDDVHGYGPERISVLDSPGASYRVFVHYFSDDALGATDATVVVAFQDAFLYSATQTLAVTDTVWEVVDLDLALGTATPIDLVYVDSSGAFAPASKL